MRKDSGLILEGGASRGVFTAGALDYLMEQDCYFPYVVGVSAGSCNAIDYVSKQIGRTRDCMIAKEKPDKYETLKRVVRTKCLFDMDALFDEYPKKTYPFDFKTYQNSKQTCEIVVTNCRTGRAEYMEEKQDFDRLLQICRASCSIPVFSPMVDLDGIPYLDGGLADSVPIIHSIKRGVKRNVVILTRNSGYRKKIKRSTALLYHKKYKEYPKLIQTMYYRAIRYNHTYDYLDKLEKEGKVFILRPDIPEVSRTETDYDTLMTFYQHGYDSMKKRYDEMRKFIE
ncbi:MAG: patatin family protein [Lachnospiraceae bacterium]